MNRNIAILAGLLATLPAVAQIIPGGRGGRGPSGGNSAAFPQRTAADPGVLERGKALYGVQCNFCHGSDARGGEGGPNLLRSRLVLEDKNGELIGPLVLKGRPDQGMPAFGNMKAAQLSDLATFIHAFPVDNRDPARFPPPSILSGDARAGETYFKAKCGSCHSVSGDLKGIGARITDPRTLQNTFVMPGSVRGTSAPALNVPPTAVTVTLAGGRKAEGRVIRIDDFIVTLIDGDGMQRTFRRNGDNPKVELHDPLKPHRDLLGTYTDKDIHNVTAYLVTVK